MSKNKPRPAESMGRFVGKKNALPLTPSILKIIVGEGDDAQEFQIHEAVLTARSKFFKAAMGRKWKESEEKTVKLPEDDPEAFVLYSQLVYTGQIPGMSDNIPQPKDVADAEKRGRCDKREDCEEEYKSLCGLYVLAEKMMDLKAKNQTIDALYHKMEVELAKSKDSVWRCLPAIEAINIMYDGTARQCAGRQILVSCFASLADGNAFNKFTDEKDIRKEFLKDLVYELMECGSFNDRLISMRHDYEDDVYHEEDGKDWSWY